MNHSRPLVIGALITIFVSFQVYGAEGDWIPQGQYRSQDGQLCCHPFRDCQPITPIITLNGYQLPSGEIVPFRQTFPSEDRKHWLCTKPDGTRRCLFAPIGGS